MKDASIYQKIDIKISPKFMTGTLVMNNICACGFVAIEGDVPIGKRYTCDVNSVRWARWRCNGCGSITDVRLIDVYSDRPFVPIQWFLLDLLDISAALPVMPKPARWEKVRDNKVAPKGISPSVRQF